VHVAPRIDIPRDVRIDPARLFNTSAPAHLKMMLLVAMATAAPAAAAAETIRVHDVASLAAAIEATALTANNGGITELALRSGVYELAGTLELPFSTSLRAERGHDVTLRLAPGASHPVLAVRNASGVSVGSIRILGHDTSEPLQRATAVVVQDGADVTLERLTVSGGVWVSGGLRHTLTSSVVSNAHGAAHGNCVYLTNAGGTSGAGVSAGEPVTLARCGHTISHTEIHDCRGLGDPWPSSVSPCDPAHQKREHKKPCNPDPFPNISGNGILINQVVGSNTSHNFVHDVNYHGIYTQARIHSKYPDPSESPSALNTIDFNHVRDYGQCAEDPVCNMTGASGQNGNPGADPGCIYFFDGPFCCYGQEVTHNFCHNIKQGGKGLYLDGTTSGISTRGNVLWNISGNIIDNNDGHDNHHMGNVAINGRSMGSLTDSDFWNCDDAKDHDGCGPHNISKLVGHTCTPHFWEHYNNYATFNQTKWVGKYFDSAAWKAEFPDIQTWFKKTTWAGPDGPVSCDQKGQFSDCCMFPTGTFVNYSVMVNTPWDAYGHRVSCSHNESKYCGWQAIRLGNETSCRHGGACWCSNSGAFAPPVGCWPIAAGFQRVGPQKLYTVDPGFEDMAAGNFAIRPDSEIFKDFPG
jgi:hypothetical protein